MAHASPPPYEFLISVYRSSFMQSPLGLGSDERERKEMKDMDSFSLNEQNKSIFGRLEFSVAFMYVVLQPDSPPPT